MFASEGSKERNETELAAFPTQLVAIQPEAIEDLVHRRMGTSNVAKLRFMAEQPCYVERGFQQVFRDKAYSRCTTCDKARMAQVINHRAIERSTVQGQRWYFDVSGPFAPALVTSNVYLGLFVEDKSGLLVKYGMRQKNDNETLRVAKEFNVEYLERVRARNVRNIQMQSDNGEFASAKLRAFWASVDVYQRFTSPYHSNQNGRVERSFGSVKGMGRSMISHLQLALPSDEKIDDPEPYWEVAAECAVFTINRTPYKLEGHYVREPIFQFFGTTANYGFFRAFGSSAVVLDIDRSKNWTSPGIAGTMVGYENDAAYKIYIKNKNKFVVSSNVRITEAVQASADHSIMPREGKSNTTDYNYLTGTRHVDPDDLQTYECTGVRSVGKQVIVDRVLANAGSEGVTEVNADAAANFRDFACKEANAIDIQRLRSFVSSRPHEEVINVTLENPPTCSLLPDPSAIVEQVQLGGGRREASTDAKQENPPAGCTAPDPIAIVEQARTSGGDRENSSDLNRSISPGRLERQREKQLPQQVGNKRKVTPKPTAVKSNYSTRSRNERTTRINNAYTLLEVYMADGIVHSFEVPKSHAQVLLSSESKLWLEAEASELSGLNESGCLLITKLPLGRKPLPCKWVYALKTDSNNVIQRYKARLCVRGDRAIEGEDWFESFSPVVRWESIRIFIALTVLLRLVPLQLDVDLAYLYAPLDEDIYMSAPPGTNLPPGSVYKLLKSLYGLPQSGRNWNTLLDKVLADWGFTRLSEDYCLYFKHDKTRQLITLLFIYVDDLYIASSTQASLEEFRSYLLTHFKIKILGIPQQLLGIAMTWGEAFKTVHINASKLVQKLLARFWVEADGYKDIPFDPRVRLLQEDQLKETKDKPLSKEDKDMQRSYRTISGTIIFLVNTCRVDLGFVSMILCRSMAWPGYKHWTAAKWALCYLARYPDLGIHYSFDGNMRPYGYADADHGSDWSRRSIVGHIFFLAGGPISWQAKMTPVVSLSTAESEIRAIDAAFPAIREACWLTKVLEELGHPLLGDDPFNKISIRTNVDFSNLAPMVVFEDNQACIKYAQNPTSHSLMKHLDRHLRWIQEQVQRKSILLIYVETLNQLADLLTKPMDPKQFWDLVSRIMIHLDDFIRFMSS